MAETMKIELLFEEELLGTASANPELVREFIASKAPDQDKTDEEVEAIDVDGEMEKSTMVFPRVDGNPILWDYQIKGFFKDACSMLRRVKDSRSAKLKAHKKIIDGLIFVSPRAIPLEVETLGMCERPLRAQTAQGERIALARSETAPVGTKIVFELTLLQEGLIDVVEDWLDYGKLRGLGQWRNSGKGRFSWREIKE